MASITVIQTQMQTPIEDLFLVLQLRDADQKKSLQNLIQAMKGSSLFPKGTILEAESLEAEFLRLPLITPQEKAFAAPYLALLLSRHILPAFIEADETDGLQLLSFHDDLRAILTNLLPLNTNLDAYLEVFAKERALSSQIEKVDAIYKKNLASLRQNAESVNSSINEQFAACNRDAIAFGKNRRAANLETANRLSKLQNQVQKTTARQIAVYESLADAIQKMDQMKDGLASIENQIGSLL